MSPLLGNATADASNLWRERPNATAPPAAPGPLHVSVSCLTGALALAALAGGAFSLASLLPVPRRGGALRALVAAWAVDDLVGALAAALCLRLQWPRGGPGPPPRPLCAAAALLHTAQGLSGNLKAALLVGYNFVSLRRAAAGPRTAWGCRVAGPAVPPLCALYAAALALLAGLAGPLALRLLCSEEEEAPPPRTRARYRAIAGRASAPGSPPPGSPPRSPPPPRDAPRAGARARPHPGHGRSFARSVAQRRFALILALTKAVLWLPMMVNMLVQHVVGVQSPPLETLSFLLTLLATTVTPVFVLSKTWAHLPCGCIINCRPNSYTVASEGRTSKRKGFEFNLSFQQSYGIYKLAQEEDYDDEGVTCTSHPSLRGSQGDSRRGEPRALSAVRVEISTRPADSAAPQAGLPGAGPRAAQEDSPKQQPHQGKGALSDQAGGGGVGHEEGALCDGPERRLSHEENLKPGLADWEWCRSRSERTPRQRLGGGLAIPLCAFQGMVSLQAPTGKTLSLSTYEVSAQGQKITPASKKIEVYRSKSVGHEPNAEDSPSTLADTSVKIHLEVLEICDNEEALDTVSIISNISQSSAQVRSPSLRYSRKENRFVSCDLGETASYSLFLPTSNPDGDISISIPDTVEAHRQNSKRQHQERDGYQEEIQLLNKAYRRREEESAGREGAREAPPPRAGEGAPRC
ncbi:probable G-protein coupled receptor 149 [Perognathus longimembris pacificus]|uniref:probable G-protein coupled receptor 149 n=1 Tax=Perognathus longimembris pacificus TaxID=214514 RepID=UPI002019D589|nr:probable G-protein coupled receptor 149 [Perognathus longimembris pacificus]